MNDRIQELHEQAMKSCDQYRDQPLVYHRMYREKFAELIVRECAEHAENYIDDSRIRDYILYQFGLE